VRLLRHFIPRNDGLNDFEVGAIREAHFGLIGEGGIEANEDIFRAELEGIGGLIGNFFIQTNVEIMSAETGMNPRDLVGEILEGREDLAIEGEALK